MEYFELMKAFHRESVAQGYKRSARELYWFLVNDFNVNYWCDELSYSERELSGKTLMPKSTIHEAREYLESTGWVSTRVVGQRIFYRLCSSQYTSVHASSFVTEPNPTTPVRASDQFPTTRPTTSSPGLLNAPEDIKDRDSIRQRSSSSTTARKPENFELAKKWRDSGGVKLTPLIIDNLNRLVDVYGENEVSVALEVAGTQNKYGYFNVNFLEGILKNRQKWSDSNEHRRTNGASKRNNAKASSNDSEYRDDRAEIKKWLESQGELVDGIG